MRVCRFVDIILKVVILNLELVLDSAFLANIFRINLDVVCACFVDDI